MTAVSSFFATLSAFLQAAAEAAKAFPIWLAWKLATDLNELDDEILRLSASASPNRARLLQLDVRHSRISRLYAVVCPTKVDASGRAGLHPSDGRDLGQSTGPLGNPSRPQ